MAERLGRTVSELQDSMTWRELLEWSAYDRHQALEAEKRKSRQAHEQWHKRAMRGQA